MDNQFQAFYGYWQLSVCLFAFLGLLSIWYHLGRKQEDTGQVWLALSILCWSISGGVEVLYAQEHLSNRITLEGIKSILSLLNSFFILMALPYFRHLPKALEPPIKSKYWLALIGLPLIFCLLPTLSKLLLNETGAFISEFDVYYSILTLVILGWVMWVSFRKRNLSFLAYLSAICIGITFVAQLYKLTNSQLNEFLFSAIFKTNLIMIFFALALSWVKDLSERINVLPHQVRLTLSSDKHPSGQFSHAVLLKGLYQQDKEIQISHTHYTLLLKFAQRRKSTGGGWLEIKPKNLPNTAQQFDIKDYNEIKRMLQAILDGYFGKSTWTKDQHETPLKKFLLERSDDKERRVRLSLPPENVEIPGV